MFINLNPFTISFSNKTTALVSYLLTEFWMEGTIGGHLTLDINFYKSAASIGCNIETKVPTLRFRPKGHVLGRNEEQGGAKLL